MTPVPERQCFLRRGSTVFCHIETKRQKFKETKKTYKLIKYLYVVSLDLGGGEKGLMKANSCYLSYCFTFFYK